MENLMSRVVKLKELIDAKTFFFTNRISLGIILRHIKWSLNFQDVDFRIKLGYNF